MFVSSTYLDNEERREVVRDAIERAGMLPVGMERFAADTAPSLEVSLRQAKTCDVLVGILAHRYGTIPDGEERSITEQEHDALSECLVFEIDPSQPFTMDAFDVEGDVWEKQKLLAAFKERMRREHNMVRFTDTKLGVVVLHALQDWRERQEHRTKKDARSVPRRHTDADLADYHQTAEAHYESVSLMGFGKSVRARIRLEDIHEPLHARLDPRGEAADAQNSGEAETGLGGGTREIPLHDSMKHAAEEARRGVVILGEPGSGKTTHLKAVLLWTIRNGAASLGLPDGMQPVFLPLRDLRAKDKTLLAFGRRILREEFPTVSEDFAKDLIRGGNVLFLLDGLDEVADEKRRVEVAGWIGREIRRYPKACFLVTCRYAGYTDRVRLDEEFLELHLRPLRRGESESFIRRWFEVVGSARKEDLTSKSEELIQLLRRPGFRAQRIVEMTRNPLLLTAICLVQFDRGQLPRGRVELYRSCVDVLLEHWRRSKELGEEVAPGLDPDRSRELLQKVALWMHQEEDRTTATEDELAEVVEPELAQIAEAGCDARIFLRNIRDAAGLLTGHSGDLYGFMHLGFQEYLAAQEIRARSHGNRRVLYELARHYSDSWWQEVILLLLSEGNPALFEPFMKELAERAVFGRFPKRLDLCIEEAGRHASPRPFVELLTVSKGGKGLWARQRQALRVLRSLAPAEVEALRPRLARHPDPKIAEQFRTVGMPGQELERIVFGPGIEAVRIPAGTFLMGSPRGVGHDNERPRRRVAVGSFYLSVHPITNEQFRAFLEEHSEAEPAYWSDRDYNQARQPVVGVDWEHARAFTHWAGGDLPTEAQWEYACRATTTTLYWSGRTREDLSRAGWFRGNAGGKVHAVAEKPPNPWGLFDMHGNVWEWCLDWYGKYVGEEQTDPAGPASGTFRVIRGGCFGNEAVKCRSSARFGLKPSAHKGFTGFRVALGAAAED